MNPAANPPPRPPRASQVLDVNVFKHPGPQRHIVDNVGTDITTLFHRNGHSTHARILCERLVVGTVKGNPGALLSNSWCSDLSEEELAIHAKLDRDVDVRQPLLPQVRKMTNREFACFISRPRTMEDVRGRQRGHFTAPLALPMSRTSSEPLHTQTRTHAHTSLSSSSPPRIANVIIIIITHTRARARTLLSLSLSVYAPKSRNRKICLFVDI